mgnify:CR=1 FL=1
MEKEFVVTVKEGANWEELHNELNRDTTLDDSVDSNIVPDRTVDTVKSSNLSHSQRPKKI